VKNLNSQIAIFVLAGFALMVLGIRKFYRQDEIVTQDDHMAKMRAAKAAKAKKEAAIKKEEETTREFGEIEDELNESIESLTKTTTEKSNGIS
jgi:hypothetical protein